MTPGGVAGAGRALGPGRAGGRKKRENEAEKGVDWVVFDKSKKRSQSR